MKVVKSFSGLECGVENCDLSCISMLIDAAEGHHWVELFCWIWANAENNK